MSLTGVGWIPWEYTMNFTQLSMSKKRLLKAKLDGHDIYPESGPSHFTKTNWGILAFDKIQPIYKIKRKKYTWIGNFLTKLISVLLKYGKTFSIKISGKSLKLRGKVWQKWTSHMEFRCKMEK